MRKFGFLIMVMLTVAAVSFGAELCVGPMPVTLTTGPVSSDICSVGGLVFSNFQAIAAVPGTPTSVNLVTFEVVGSDVFLHLNPGLLSAQDIWFYFTVTGPLGGVDLSLSGVNAASTEVVCSSPLLKDNNCPQGTELARIANVSGAPPVESYFDQVNTAYIYKNITVQGSGELSSLTQSFHVVPEPMSFVLIGTGLLGLGLLRRRASR